MNKTTTPEHIDKMHKAKALKAKAFNNDNTRIENIVIPAHIEKRLKRVKTPSIKNSLHWGITTVGQMTSVEMEEFAKVNKHQMTQAEKLAVGLWDSASKGDKWAAQVILKIEETLINRSVGVMKLEQEVMSTKVNTETILRRIEEANKALFTGVKTDKSEPDKTEKQLP